MTDYIGLLQGHFATTDAILGQVHSRLNDERPGSADLKGHGDYIDAWRHGGSAALLAYHHGYDNVKRWGDALEDYRPDNEQEFRQDVRNNEVGAKIGALARITGMTIPELGDALKAAFKAGAFQTDAYAPFSGGPTVQVGNMKISIGSGVVSLPDGSRFDLTKSTIIPVDGVEYPVLHVIKKDGSVQNMWTNMEDSRTLFQGGVGKWELPPDGNASSASFNDRFPAAIPQEAPDGPSPVFAQTQEAERLVSEQNPVNSSGLPAAELNRFYDATGNPAADQQASIANARCASHLPRTSQTFLLQLNFPGATSRRRRILKQRGPRRAFSGRCRLPTFPTFRRERSRAAPQVLPTHNVARHYPCRKVTRDLKLPTVRLQHLHKRLQRCPHFGRMAFIRPPAISLQRFPVGRRLLQDYRPQRLIHKKPASIRERSPMACRCDV